MKIELKNTQEHLLCCFFFFFFFIFSFIFCVCVKQILDLQDLKQTNEAIK